MKKLIAVLSLALLLTGCVKQPANTSTPTVTNTPQSIARDAIAFAGGAIKAEQAKHQDSCNRDKTQKACVLINKAIAAENLAITSLEAYCASPAFNAGTGPCVPDKSLAPKLQAAISNLNAIVADVKALGGN